jgi:glycosyltransferase involved in cell wall biosynthesis
VITISAVIPTYNRSESLLRTLRSLALQTELPEEVIIVDASEAVDNENDLINSFPLLHLTYIHSRPSVCVQRNTGILRAAGSYIFLCDDDLEFPENYISKMKAYVRDNPGAMAVTGAWNEKNAEGKWEYEYPLRSIGQLCWKFIFQQSIWCDINKMKARSYNRFMYRFVFNFYLKRRNTYSLAGWPLVTHFERPVFTTAFYSLGASFVRRDRLLSSPFYEGLDVSGIGDHYGVELNFPSFPAVHVLTDVPVYHHKAKANRLSEAEAYYKRGLALHYFMSQSQRFTFKHRVFLIWSLFGNWIAFLVKGKRTHRHAARGLISVILKGKSPYLAKTDNKKLLM